MPLKPGGEPPQALAAARDLAWTGQHAQAIECCGHALAARQITPAQRMDLLDLRAESLIAEGRFADAAHDAAAMLSLARAHKQSALEVRALNRHALVLMRRGQIKPALDVATRAVALARKARNGALLAHSLLCLGEAQFRATQNNAAIASGKNAARLFEAAGDTLGVGRAHWVVAFAHSRLAQGAPSRAAAQRAAELARETGDEQGLANALNVLSFGCTDIAERIAVLQQGAQACERSGYAYGRALVKSNLSLAFAELGLYRHACRLGEELMVQSERAGARQALAFQMSSLIGWKSALGEAQSARARWTEYDALVTALDEPATRNLRWLDGSALALAEGDSATAVKGLRAALRELGQAKSGHELRTLVALAKALLVAGDAAAALRISQRAARLHRAQDFARAGLGQSQDIWWWHSRALAANGRPEESWTALQRAHTLLLDAVRNVRDEGLRRSYLNKVEVNRDIVRAWLRESARRKLPDAQRLEHLAIQSGLGEPFKRLVDTGMRLNELRSAQELQDFLIDEVTELSGAERVLLLLETPGEVQIAGALLPAGEDARALLHAITP